jgi:DNA repair protein RecN (Recombination protein N)
MLKSLNISSFAVIDYLSVDFHSGLNVLTGETGSGKSIIVDALSLLLGARSSSAQIRSGEAQAIIEGVFVIPEECVQGVRGTLGELGLSVDRELIIRREIHVAGRGRVYINGESATVGVLRKLQPFLSEIYGQGEQRSLLSAQSHRDLLDRFGQCLPIRNQIKDIFQRLRASDKELKQLVKDRAERDRSRDFQHHQLSEINDLKPEIGEDEKLLVERKKLAHAERINELCALAYQELYESDESIISRLALIRRQLEELGGLVEGVDSPLKSLADGVASLTDVAEALRDYVTNMELSPERLAEVESRLAQLEKLKRKYGKDLEGILKVRGELESGFFEAGAATERIDALEREVAALRKGYMEHARKLSSCRQASAPQLEQRVKEGLRHVAMGQVQFLVSLETYSVDDEETANEEKLISSEETEDSDSSSSFFSSSGADYVEFLLSANPGESPRPLSYIASGGELSRLMLTLRTISGDDEMTETIVFDEIDVGIGGRVADAVGQRLKSLSASRQVFCVTHQAQIAKFADHHFVVTKSVQNERTNTNLRELSSEERVGELSRMIGGNEEAEKTREAAKWLLENA